LAQGIARILFSVDGDNMILLHGFIKKTQKTPLEALAVADKGDAIMSKTRKTNSRQGSSLSNFLKEEGIYDAVVTQAEKEILAWKLHAAMKEKKLTVSGLAKRMHTSRAAINRILDPANPSITLSTLERAASALGKRWRFDLVDA
jgi:DNA-binding Xre family transcriptional regulator